MSEQHTPAKPGSGECARCATPLNPTRPWQRFCSVRCRNRWHAEERRQALAAYRADARNCGRHELEHIPGATQEEGSP